MISRSSTMENFIADHTMLPYYIRFLPLERRHNAMELLLAMDKKFYDAIYVRKNKSKKRQYMRYCPLCAAADREKYGETYWHRIHQMHGIRICPTHHCYLIETDIRMDSRVSPSLVTSEEVVNTQNPIILSENPITFAARRISLSTRHAGLAYPSAFTTCPKGATNYSSRNRQYSLST